MMMPTKQKQRPKNRRCSPKPLDEKKMDKDKDNYKVVFRGATISKKEAKRVGVTLLFGMVGIVANGLTLRLNNKISVFVLSFLLALIGYFGIGKRIYK